MLRFCRWRWFTSIMGWRIISRVTSPACVALHAGKNEIEIAVVGAHLSGMPLNPELRLLGARLLEKTSTTNDYRLYELVDGPIPKPGLLRVSVSHGLSIEVEVWAMPTENFGRFVASIPPPLSMGTLNLISGRAVKGFLVEGIAVVQARDISSFGGWRAFIIDQKNLST